MSTTSQYTRHHIVTCLVANWGVAQTHAHNLNDGWGNGYTPNHVYVTEAFVTVNGTNYAIPNRCVTITAVGATTITYIVGSVGTTDLRDAIIKKTGSLPTSITFNVLTRMAHSIEIGSAATGDEDIPPTLLGGMLPLDMSDLSPGTGMETIYVRTGGADTNNGRTVGSAFLTVQRALNDIMAESPLHHSILVDIGPGTFAGTWNLDGVQLCNGAKIYVIGNAPTRGGALDKTTTSAGAAAWSTPRDWMGGTNLRITPDAAWDVAVAATDIGKILMLDDGAGGHITMATIANVQVTGAPATDYIDINPSASLVGALPAWLNNAGSLPLGVRLTILDQNAATTVTSITGAVSISNIQSTYTTGNGAMLTTATTNTQNLLGDLRFTSTVTIEGANRFAYHGCRFESTLLIANCMDCTSSTNSVPQAGVSRYWPAQIWTRLGYSHSESAQAWGGMGFTGVGATFSIYTSMGTIAGMTGIMKLIVTSGSDINFTSCSFNDTFTTQYESYSAVTYSRLSVQAVSSFDGHVAIRDYVTWAGRANALDDTIANAPVALAGGMLSIGTDSYGSMTQIAATRIEGRNSNVDPTNVVVAVGRGGKFVSTGGHDGNLYGDAGWISMAGGSIGVMTGDRTFARKNNVAEAYDVYVYNAVLQTGAADIWTKTGGVAPNGDNVPSPVIFLDHHANFKLGTPVQAGPFGRLVAGATGAGAGLNCGANGTVHIRNGSHATIADFRINNDDGAAGNPAIQVLHASFLHFTGENVGSYIERIGVAANAIQQGSIATLGYIPTGEAAHRALYSDYLAAIGTAQGTYMRHE